MVRDTTLGPWRWAGIDYPLGPRLRWLFCLPFRPVAGYRHLVLVVVAGASGQRAPVRFLGSGRLFAFVVESNNDSLERHDTRHERGSGSEIPGPGPTLTKTDLTLDDPLRNHDDQTGEQRLEAHRVEEPEPARAHPGVD